MSPPKYGAPFYAGDYQWFQAVWGRMATCSVTKKGFAQIFSQIGSFPEVGVKIKNV